MKLRIAGLVNDSIVDGPGFRLAVFTQGCPHNCPGCHNPETHDFNGGSDMDTAEIILTMEDNPLLDGVTLTGGDPFCQPEACLEVARAAHKRAHRAVSGNRRHGEHEPAESAVADEVLLHEAAARHMRATAHDEAHRKREDEEYDKGDERDKVTHGAQSPRTPHQRWRRRRPSRNR